LIAIRLALVVFAGLLLGKMILQPRVYHYGFVLAMPATLLLVTTLVAWLPAVIDRAGGCGKLFRAAALAALPVAVAAHLVLIGDRLRPRTQPVGEGADRFLADERGEAARWVLARLAQHGRAGETLAVFPDGAMLNFLARRASPTPYYTFMPAELAIFGESRMAAALREHPPDFAVLRPRSMSEYGYRAFGVDYGLELSAWLERHYEPVHLEEALELRERDLPVLLLRRKPAP
jgi:hypothetical protein